MKRPASRSGFAGTSARSCGGPGTSTGAAGRARDGRAGGLGDVAGGGVGVARLVGHLAEVARPLLGAVRRVARAPADVGVAHDHPLELVEAVEERLGAGRAAGHVDVDRQELVGALDDGVVGEHAARRRAGAHRDDPLRLEHLVVEAADDRRHLDRDAAREDQHVRLARRGAHRLGAEARDVVARRDDRHHLDRAAGEAEGRGEDRVRPPPVEDLVEAGREQGLLDHLLEVDALDVAAQEVARADLAHVERLVGIRLVQRQVRPDLLAALDLHGATSSRVPRGARRRRAPRRGGRRRSGSRRGRRPSRTPGGSRRPGRGRRPRCRTG